MQGANAISQFFPFTHIHTYTKKFQKDRHTHIHTHTHLHTHTPTHTHLHAHAHTHTLRRIVDGGGCGSVGEWRMVGLRLILGGASMES